MKTRKLIKRRLTSLSGDENGSVLVEAAFVVPIVIVMLTGIMEWGVALYQYHLLATATSESVRQLIISRGTATPYDYAFQPFTNWASSLGITKAQVTVEVQDPAKADYAGYLSCTDNASCISKLSTEAGKPARVTVNYTCTMAFTPKFISPCPINIQMIGIVE